MKTEVTNQPSVEQFLSGKLNQVDVAGIERELKELWHSAQEGVADGHGPAVARACVLNFIAYSTETNAEVTAGELLDEIAVQHPCRALLAIARSSEELRLEAWVSTRCHLPSPNSSKQICCEQITVRWEGQGIYELPSAVVPLLLPDLPVFLFWRTGDFDTSALQPFLKSIDRLIIDSRRWTVPFRAFPLVTFYLKQKSGSPIISDLNWRRILEWRRLLAGSFEDAGMGLTIEDLSSIQSVNLKYVAPSSCQAFLLISWLAARLNWQPRSRKVVSVSSTEMTFQGRDNTISVGWESVPSQMVPDGALVNVDISMSGGKHLSIELVAKDNLPCLVAKGMQAGKPVKELIVNVPDLHESRLISLDLEVLEHETAYEEAMMMAHRIAIMS